MGDYVLWVDGGIILTNTEGQESLEMERGRVGRVILVRENELAKQYNETYGENFPVRTYAVIEFEGGRRYLLDDEMKLRRIKVQ